MNYSLDSFCNIFLMSKNFVCYFQNELKVVKMKITFLSVKCSRVIHYFIPEINEIQPLI